MDTRTLSLTLVVAGVMIQTFVGFVGPSLGLQSVTQAWISAVAATLSAGIIALLRYLPSPEQEQKAAALVQRNETLYGAVANLSAYDPANTAAVESSIVRAAGRGQRVPEVTSPGNPQGRFY